MRVVGTRRRPEPGAPLPAGFSELDGPADLAVHHLGAAERAEELAERLRERLPRAARLLVSEVGAVIGAHTGTGLLGIVVVPRRDGARR